MLATRKRFGLPGTFQLTEVVEHALATTTHWSDVSTLRSNLVAYFGDRYSFEILAAALEACEVIESLKCFGCTVDTIRHLRARYFSFEDARALMAIADVSSDPRSCVMSVEELGRRYGWS